MILQVLILGGLLRCLQLVCHWLRRIEAVDVRLNYVLLTLASKRCGSALVLLVDLAQVDHLLVGGWIHEALVREGIQVLAGARDQGTVVELLPLGLHDVDELVAGEALRVHARLLVGLVYLVGRLGVHAGVVASLLASLALLGRGGGRWLLAHTVRLVA